MSTLIVYTFPLFSAIVMHFACCTEPEKLSKFAWLCSLIAFVGIFLVVYSNKAGANSNVKAGIILSLIAATCETFQIVMLRRTRDEVHWLQIEFFTGCFNALVLTPIIWLIQ